MAAIQPITTLVDNSNLSPAEAVDYWAVAIEGRRNVDWAEARGVTEQAVSENVNKAMETLKDDDASYEGLLTAMCHVVAEYVGCEPDELEPVAQYDSVTIPHRHAQTIWPYDLTREWETPIEEQDELNDQFDEIQDEFFGWWGDHVCDDEFWGDGCPLFIRPLTGKRPDVTVTFGDLYI